MASRRRSPNWRPDCPISRSTPPSSGRPTSSSFAFDNLTRALLLGCLLVMLVLAAFLFEWRTALISLVAIPLSLVAGTMVAHRARCDAQHDDPRRIRHRHRRGRG
jgi:hypothetical protein